MKTRIAFIAAFLLVAQALMPVVVHAATIPVTSTADSGPGTLRTALASSADGDTIDATGVSGTILLTTGELVVSNSVTILGPGPASLAVDGNADGRVFYITNAVNATISSLAVSNGVVGLDLGGGIYNDHSTLTVTNCALTANSANGAAGGIYNNGEDSGSATLIVANSTFNDNSGDSHGGAIHNSGRNSGNATLIVTDSTFSGNASSRGGAIANAATSSGIATVEISNSTLSSNSANNGGGIFNAGGGSGGSATVKVRDSTLSGNTSYDNGGGIFNDGSFEGDPIVEISASTLSGNSAGGGGGGIYNDGSGSGSSATVAISASTISSNSAGSAGGGIENNGVSDGSATVEIVTSTLSDNSAGTVGGGILSNGGNGDATVTIANSTLSGNSAVSTGGGIYNLGAVGSATLTVSASTLSGNSAVAGGGIYNSGPGGSATLEIGDTILNAGASGENIIESFATVTSRGYNLSSDAAGGGPGTGPDGLLNGTADQRNTDPLLGPLQDNGGPTFTHALLCGSPAIDQGYNFSASATDQRGAGFARTFDDPAVANATGGDGTDIGAFERQTDCNNPPVAQCHDVTVSAGANCTADASIDNGSSDPDAGDTITLSQDPPGPYGLGTTPVTLTVTDNHGASSSCSAHVTVVDTTPPQINCPANIVTDATSPAGAVVSFAPTASDNCSVVSVISTPSSGSTFAIGTTTVTCRATDGAGLTSSCTFTIRVKGAADTDGDGVADAIDKCSDTPHGAIVNAKGCSIAQLVPCDGPQSGGKWKSHGQYVRAVVEVATDFLKAKLITRKQWVQIVTRAAWSKCGWTRHRDHDWDRDWHRDWDCDRDRDWGRGRDWG